jgi:hypothetical protein
MGWNGSGTIALLYDFTTDRDAGSPTHFILSERVDAMFNDIADAIEATINRNGENAAAANISWGTYKITNLGAATTTTDAVRARQVAENAIQYGGSTGGAANAYTVTNAFISAAAAGTRLLCLANHTNNGASTLNVNGGGAVAIKTDDGSTALAAGEIVSSRYFEVVYDGTVWRLYRPGIEKVMGASITPIANDGASLGTASLSFSDLFLASGGVINWNNGDVTATHSANTLTFGGASSGYQFDALVAPSSSDGAALGSASLMWSDAFFASGAVLNFNNGDVTITHSANVLAFGGAASGYTFTHAILPSASDGAALGSATVMWADLFLASGGVINWNNGRVTLTQNPDALFFRHTYSGSNDALAFGFYQDAATTGYATYQQILSINNDGYGDGLNVYLSRGTTSAKAVVQSGDEIDVCGTFAWDGDQYINNSYIAAIIDGTPGNNDMPTKLIFQTCADGAAAIVSTSGVQLTPGGAAWAPMTTDNSALGTTAKMWSDLFLASGGVINWNNGAVSLLQSGDDLFVRVTESGSENAITFGTYSDGASEVGSYIDLRSINADGYADGYYVYLTRGTTAAKAIVQSGDEAHLLNASFYNGSGEFRTGASVSAFIDGTPGVNDMPTKLKFQTTADGASGVSGGVELSPGSAAWRPTANDGSALGESSLSWSDLFLASGGVINFNNGNLTMTHSAGALAITGVTTLASATATPAGGSTSARACLGTTSGFGIYYGSGAPTVTAAKGSLYLRSDGSSTSTRMYVNTDAGTTWTAVTTAA